MIAKIALPRILRIGGGAFKETGQLLQTLGLRAPLIVTDPFFTKQGLADRLSEILEQSDTGAVVFSRSVPDPTTPSVDPGLAALIHGPFDSLTDLPSAISPHPA